ncbi:hypothetical protein [Rubritalea squalenifaciens]|nr:hypothetical protein [Rubritalea squalenifaciens]
MRIVLAMMLSALPLVAEIPKEHLQTFYRVSVECQNGRYKIQHLRPGMNIDPSQVEPFVKRIDELLGELVEKKALKQEVIELKNPNEMEREEQGKMFKMVMDAVGNLGEEYGFYVAAEMVDMA